MKHIPTDTQLLGRAIASTLRYLSHRPRSDTELKIWLTKRFDHAVTRSVLARMRYDGLVDDLKFSDFWVNNRSFHRPRSARLIHRELLIKGISTDIADRAVQHIDNEEMARRVALDRSKTISHRSEPLFLKKLIAHIQRRGFYFSEAQQAARYAWEQMEANHCTKIGASIDI